MAQKQNNADYGTNKFREYGAISGTNILNKDYGYKDIVLLFFKIVEISMVVKYVY